MRQIVLFVHLAAAVFWIGEMLMVAFVLGPASRTLPARERSELFRLIGRTSLPLAWTAIGVLVVTGLLNLVLMGIPLQRLLQRSFYHTAFGLWLGLKLLAVLALVALSALHDFHIGRRANAVRRALQTAPDGVRVALAQDADRYRSLAMRVGMTNVLLALFVLFAAAALVALG